MSALLILPLCKRGQSCHPVDGRSGREKQVAMSKEKIEKIAHYLLYGLLLAVVITVGIFSTSERMHQILILATLLFLQVFLLFEVFQPGNNP
jgi:hypothetical protein